MITKIIYDKYDTSIDTAIFKFGEEDEVQEIVLKVKEFIDEEEIDESTGLPKVEKKVLITSKDLDNLEIENVLAREDLKTLLSVARNLLKQI